MKKLFLFAAMFAAMFLTVIGGKTNQTALAQSPARQSFIKGGDDVPDEVRQVAKDLYVEIKTEWDQKEAYLKDIYFEGKTLVCEMVVEEVLLNGRTMKQDLLQHFDSEEEYIKKAHDQIIPRNKNKTKRLRFDPLRINHYNLMYRYVGSRSGEKIEIVVKYYEFPKE